MSEEDQFNNRLVNRQFYMSFEHLCEKRKVLNPKEHIFFYRHPNTREIKIFEFVFVEHLTGGTFVLFKNQFIYKKISYSKYGHPYTTSPDSLSLAVQKYSKKHIADYDKNYCDRCNCLKFCKHYNLNDCLMSRCKNDIFDIDYCHYHMLCDECYVFFDGKNLIRVMSNFRG
jgi:hypothetical protein